MHPNQFRNTFNLEKLINLFLVLSQRFKSLLKLDINVVVVIPTKTSLHHSHSTLLLNMSNSIIHHSNKMSYFKILPRQN